MSFDKLLQMIEAFKVNNTDTTELNSFHTWKEFENSVAAPYWCFMYCSYCIVKPDKSLEYIIARSSKFSYLYSKIVLKNKFSKGTASIATNAEYSYLYAKNVLKNIFLKGEKIIATNAEYSYLYSEYFKKPIGEAVIATSPHYSLQYAKNILKNRFQLGELAMNRHKSIAREYREFLYLLAIKDNYN